VARGFTPGALNLDHPRPALDQPKRTKRRGNRLFNRNDEQTAQRTFGL